MKAPTSFLIFTLLLLTPRVISAQSAKQIVIGQIDSLQSKILNEKRNIWVHVPKSYAKVSTQRYPVVYLLDGNAHFSSVVGMIEQLSSVNGNMICPEMIVVGIPNTNRMRDLSPIAGARLPRRWIVYGGKRRVGAKPSPPLLKRS